MMELFKRRSKKAGLPPGSLVHVGERKADKTEIFLMDYDEAGFREKEIKEVEECRPFRDLETVTWINMTGIHQVEAVKELAEAFGIHPLVQEDILNTDQRTKIENYDDYIFFVLKMFYYDQTEHEIVSEQISLILGRNFVISFQESEKDVFDPVRERIRNKKGRIRRTGADYLAYALLDSVVDNYFLILEKFGESLELLEDEVYDNPAPETLGEIHRLKREAIILRRAIWPLREVIAGLEREESELIQERTEVYLRDLYDHAVQVIETVESFREMTSGLLDIYLSSVSNKMNEVMKVLTIIATIFIPLGFLAGVYGMNFSYMPELSWHYGYFVAISAMALVALSLLLYFKRKNWI